MSAAGNGKGRELGIGFVGTGKISRQFAAAVRATPGVLPRLVYSRERETGKSYAKECGVAASTDSWEGFLSDPGVDAVYIATPNVFHFPQALDALRAGKHVLCEKPLTTDAARFDRLAAEAKARGLVLMEGMRILHDPVYRLIRRSLEQIGRIKHVELIYCQYSSRYDKFKEGVVLNAFDPSLSNAAVMDIGVYPVALSAALFGMADKITASSTFLYNHFEGAGSATLTYDGFDAVLTWSKIADATSPSVIAGENGSILIDRLSGTTRVDFAPAGGRAETVPYVPSENNMIYEAADLRDAIRGTLDPEPFLEISRKTVLTLDAIRRCAGIVFPLDGTDPERV
ncbi:MAG: Gfo/Idh/MocA family oxidoreductase [Clostridia bacterium]|nr:Gfo/Idh/MocA family oxidoreductase [Clostridia bacterium]